MQCAIRRAWAGERGQLSPRVLEQLVVAEPVVFC